MIAIKSAIIEKLLINVGLAFLTHIILYYFWCRISKESFYYQEKFEMQKNWIYDVLNHWNSGVIVYNANKQKLKFFNDYLKKYEEFQEKSIPSNLYTELNIVDNTNEEVNSIVVRPSFKYLKVDDLHVLNDIIIKYNLFRHLFDINQELPQELINSFKTFEFIEILDLINKLYPSGGLNENQNNMFINEFIFLGHIYLSSESSKRLFEVSMHGYNSNKGMYYEFMMNDVTKTKVLEENRIKEKTLILGKISHEFKNPLIVVDEVVEQIIEDINNKTNGADYIKKMNFMKNLCNYMIILVKDFEVVGSLENNLQIDPIIDVLDIKPFLRDIGDIINTLIDKKAVKNVEFLLNIDSRLDKVKTDSIRLKQVLINLLSNSVKFTEAGYIELKAEIILIEQEEGLKVEVKNIDSDVNIKLLDKDNDNNKDGIITFDPKHKTYIQVNQTDQADQVDQVDNALVHFNNNKFISSPQKLQAQQNKHNTTLKTYVRFSVIDSGKGISESLINLINSEKAVNVFQKDTSSSNSLGTGYGLNIVQRLCKILNSKLQVKLKEDPKGSIFYFDILQEDLKYSKSDELNQNLQSMISFPNSTQNIQNKSPIYDVDNKKSLDLELAFNLEEKVIFKDKKVDKLDNLDNFDNFYLNEESKGKKISKNKFVQFNNNDKLIFDKYKNDKDQLLAFEEFLKADKEKMNKYTSHPHYNFNELSEYDIDDEKEKFQKAYREFRNRKNLLF